MNTRIAVAGTLAVLAVAGVVLFDNLQPPAKRAAPQAAHVTVSPSPAVKVSPAAELPPHCTLVKITDFSGRGPVLYTDWCGTGSAGESPMRSGVVSLTVDGTALRAADCTKGNPCVIAWPASPAR